VFGPVARETAGKETSQDCVARPEVICETGHCQFAKKKANGTHQDADPLKADHRQSDCRKDKGKNRASFLAPFPT